MSDRAAVQDEARIRQDLAGLYRLVAHFGWDDLIFTHISARLPGDEHHFLINPYGHLFEEITASSLVRIDQEGNKLDGSPHAVNPAGFTIHSAVHAAREDAQFVIHTHSPACVAVSCLEQGLLPLSQTALLVRERVAYHDYEGLALDPAERERLVANLGTCDMLLLRNHGVLALGRTAADAFLSLYFLERACEVQIATLGQKLILPQGLPPRTNSVSDATLDERLWPALLRLLARNYPDYAD